MLFVSSLLNNGRFKCLPLGRKPRTLTTTFTLPPGVGLETPSSRPIGITTLSRDLKEGLEAVDLMAAVEAVDTMLVAVVLALIADLLDIELAEECETEPRWLYKRTFSAISVLLSLNNCTR
jgi:hypothetical protein